MLKIILLAGAVTVGAIVSTALAINSPGAPLPPAAPRAAIDPTALTLQARNLPLIEVDRAF